MKPLFEKIYDAGEFPGIKIYKTKLLKCGSAITLPCIGIFIHSNIKGVSRKRMLQHEYGHYLDYLSISKSFLWRFFKFYFFVGLPSLINAATGIGGKHRNFWTELRANQYAEKWFGNNLTQDFKEHYPTTDVA